MDRGIRDRELTHYLVQDLPRCVVLNEGAELALLLG
jgi:hypothetical protein